MATTKYSDRRLQELKHSNYEIADGEPDIKGWDVQLSSGEEIGEVDDLIFDTESLKVRYLIVDLKGKVLDTDSRDVLIPVGLAQLKHLTHNVVLNNVTVSQLKSLPEYDEDDFTPDFENRVRQAFSDTYMGTGTVAGNEDFYAHKQFDDEHFSGTGDYSPDRTGDNLSNARNNFEGTGHDSDDTVEVVKENVEVGKRQVQTGGIKVRSRIVEKPVEETINLKEENVNVERIPVDRVAGEGDFSEQEIEMRENAEVPVVNKEARIVEEITLSKETEERDETIHDTVRETKVEVDDIPGNERKNKNRSL
jgi:stress response protein YsnF